MIVLFLCRQNIPLGAPEFVRNEENAYYFDFKTSLACRPQPVDCQVQDEKGTQYDLSPLARSGTNWQVLDTRPGYSDLTYYINVCRPINSIAGSTCPGLWDKTMFNIHVVNKIKVICLWILSSRFSMILWVFFLYGRCHNLQFNIIYGIFLFFPCNVCIGCMLYYFLQIQNNVPQNACMFYIMYNGTYSKNNHVLMYLAKF